MLCLNVNTFARIVCFFVNGDFYQNCYNVTFVHPLNDPMVDTAMTLHSIRNMSYVIACTASMRQRHINAANRRMLMDDEQQQMMNYDDISLQSVFLG
jgi:uncharacterized glyoxalase superfamily metalloenzyme YdcJ